MTDDFERARAAGRDRRDHNGPLRSWMQRFAAEQLVPLHGRYPIASIELVSV